MCDDVAEAAQELLEAAVGPVEVINEAANVEGMNLGQRE
jgi:hypothetical protein